MPRIDPQQLLTCLTPLLAQNGGIKSAGEVIRLANLMEKYSKKLVSKCIYIQILKCTETDLLGQFMAAGGWNLVHNWLNDGVASNNWAFIQELLEMLLLCPVDGNRLKSNHTPKTVKNLSISCEQQTVKILSSKLVEQWLRIAHQEKQQLTASQSNRSEENSQPELKAEEPQENGVEKPADSKSEDESVKKSSSENVKYKVNNKESSGKLLLTLKRSTSPSVDEKDSKVSRTSSESKSKSSSSSKSSDKDKEKEKKSSSSSSSSSSHRSSSKSSHRDKDKERSSSHHKSSSRDKDKDKHSSSSSRSSSSKSSSSSRDKDRKKDSHDKEKEKEKSQAEKDKETLDFLTPMPSAKLQRIPKRQHSENSENKSSESNDASPGAKVEKKKPSISIEVRKGDKPKTVKTLNSQFRNHGLAEEPPKPPSRKDLKKPTTPVVVTPPVAAPVVAKPSSSPPPSKKIHLDTSNVPEREGGAKLIKPKPMIMESIGFMDALSASAATKKDPKKRKRLPSNSTAKKDEPESPKIDVKPLKFYKDTLEENEEEATNGEKSPTKEVEATTSEETKEESPVKTETSEEVKTEKSSEKEEVPEEKRKPGIGCGPDGPPGVLVDPNMPRRKKRPIRWRSEEELTEIRYFELDENERVNVTKTFTEQKQIEHGEERSAFRLGQRLASEDTMVEQTKWRPLIPIDNTLQFDYGSKSREVLIQAEREKNVLQELYLGASFIETPKEPDHENYEHIEPQTIPLEDVTGNPDSVTNFTDIPWPTPKGELPSTFTNNAFANVFSGVNIPSGIGIPPAIGISNPLAAFANPPNPMITPPWLVQQPPFMQPPPNIMPQGPPGFNNRGGMNHNNHNSNNNFRGNNRPYNNSNNSGGGNWVRGNQRRGICNQFQRTGVCRNKSCPYIHER